jgi:hypothetical protein
VIINTPQELAYGLRDTLKLNLTARPWNVHHSADTLWWLVPSAEWPAFRLGKLAFSFPKDDMRERLIGNNDQLLGLDKMLAGFYVEKGYGNVASFVNPALKYKPQQILDPNWCWLSVVNGSGPETFGAALSAAAAQIDMYVFVDVAGAHDRELTVRTQHDSMMFKATGGPKLEFVMDNKCPLGVLLEARCSKDFSELAQWLREIDGYHWVDLYVGTHVHKGEVAVGDLYKTLACFDPWVK